MDTTPEYIKMCEKAKEIQETWKPTGGDFYLHNYRGTTGFSPETEKVIWPDDDKFVKIEILCYQPEDVKDFWVCTNGDLSHVISAQDLFKHHCVWLPRQDQLQEMVLKKDFNGIPLSPADWLQDFRVKVMHVEYSYYCKFGSLEQVWLAFVMKEKYGKVWNGDDWA